MRACLSPATLHLMQLSPEIQALRDVAHLHELYELLPAEERRLLIVLLFLDGHTQRRVADELKVSPSTVSRTLDDTLPARELTRDDNAGELRSPQSALEAIAAQKALGALQLLTPIAQRRVLTRLAEAVPAPRKRAAGGSD